MAILFNQHQPNIQPIDEFTIDAVWSHVFSLNEKSSVAHAIQDVKFCADALVPLLATVKAGLHYNWYLKQQLIELNSNSWSQNYPLMVCYILLIKTIFQVLQLITFLYQNSEQFFLICHTETFILLLFGTLLPPTNDNSQQQNQQSINDKSSNEPESPSLFTLPTDRASRHILELLTNLLLNDLCLNHESRLEWLFDALFDYLEGGGNSNCTYQSILFTELVNSCLERFMSSNMFFSNSVSMASLMIPQAAQDQQVINHSSELTAINVIHFLSKVLI